MSLTRRNQADRLLESPGGLSVQNQEYDSYEEYSDDFSDGPQLTLPSNAADSPSKICRNPCLVYRFQK